MTSIPQAWPRGMALEIAAAYVGLSRNTFQRLVETGDAPAPVWLTKGRKVWDQKGLDAWLDRRFGTIAPSPDYDPVMEAMNGKGPYALHR